jgi:hypothetical protein
LTDASQHRPLQPRHCARQGGSLAAAAEGC